MAQLAPHVPAVYRQLRRSYFNVVKQQYVEAFAQLQLADVQYIYNIAGLWTLAGYSPRAIRLANDRLDALGVTTETHSLALTLYVLSFTIFRVKLTSFSCLTSFNLPPMVYF